MYTSSAARLRLEAAVTLIICWALLGAAFWLKPSPYGYGTHQQLYLPPCMWRLITHLPCPFCGLTTGFAWMARGQIRLAMQANLLAPVAYGTTIIASLLALYGVISGRNWRPRWLAHPQFSKWLLLCIFLFWGANLLYQWSRGHV